jgi:hypothetical protein
MPVITKVGNTITKTSVPSEHSILNLNSVETLAQNAYNIAVTATGSDSSHLLGTNALSAIHIGYNSVASGSSSIAIGLAALSTGFSAISIGYASASGADAIAIGTLASASGTNSIALGKSTKADGANSVAIGYNITVNAPNQIVLGNSSVTGVYSTAFYSTSSERYKHNINTITGALSKVDTMRGVTYQRNIDNMEQIGLIAEEVYQVIPEVVNLNELGQPDSINYANLVGLLIEAIKELKQEVDTLKG